MNKIIIKTVLYFCIILIIAPSQFAQSNNIISNQAGDELSTSSANQQINSILALENSIKNLPGFNGNNLSLARKKIVLRLNTNVAETQNLLPGEYIPWETEKHFWVAVGEMAILEFIPWAMAKWVRNWEDPNDNWANVSSESWWRNLSSGWEYDGDNFTTNNFAHPYHGALFFNAGRSNGYDFWESTAFSLTGSAIWEFFGETFRPAFNDWIYTGIGGANLGEILYRLSSMVTDNRASGSERVWSEIWGTLINPVRGFNRAISGEMGQNFDNPTWSRPKDFLFEFDAGTRTIDENSDDKYREGDTEGLFTFAIHYGNPFKAKKPFEYFTYGMGISSGVPHFTNLNSSGYLFGFELEKQKHKINVNLDFNYDNLVKEETTAIDTVYNGFLFGATQLYPHLLSRFPIGEKTEIVTQIGVNAILMGATFNDYFIDVEGRVYDFGPGIGTRLYASIRSGIWDYFRVFYYGAWMFTQSEPSDSKHHIHFLLFEAQYPFTSFFSFGIRAGVYWRNSYYENFPDVNKDHPIVRVFFRTAIINY